MKDPSELQLGQRTKYLVDACQVVCVPDCCGIGAYDFSPLYTAAYLTRFTGVVSKDDVRAISDELDALLAEASTLRPNSDGFVCSISGMNQYFTANSLREFADDIRRSMSLAPKVVEFANHLVNEESEQAVSGNGGQAPSFASLCESHAAVPPL
jgi:hypothetical protein